MTKFQAEIVPGDEYEAVEGAAAVVARAEAEAARLEGEARERVSNLWREAEAEVEAYREAARADIENELEGWVELERSRRLSEGLRELDAAVVAARGSLDSAASWFALLVTRTAGRVIGRLSPDAQTIAIVREALSELRRDWDVVLHVSPARRDKVAALVEANRAAMPMIVGVEARGELGDDEMRLETPAGLCEIGVGAQLETLRAALEVAIAEGPEPRTPPMTVPGAAR